jgi:hypothetical protein
MRNTNEPDLARAFRSPWIGSNYDPTGSNTLGRVTVAFRGNWAQATDLARTSVQGLELVEVA